MKVKHLRKLMLLGITVFWLSIPAIPAGAQVNIQVGIQLPPLIVFSSPPEMVVLPETYVYVVPDIEEDVFFFDGFWWRPWQGHWYRSQYYDRGWGYYSSVPTFYREVPQTWRHDYREHQWRGQPWNYQRMHHQQVEKNWNTWKKDKYFEKNQAWGVQRVKSQPQKQGQQPQARQPQARQPEHHGQQPQAHKQQSQQPNKSQVHQGQRNQGQGQGNKGQGQGKAAKQQGDKKNNQDKGKEKQ
jgi:hypothetical protein